MKVCLGAIAAVLLAFPARISAHGGGLDAFGCHNNRKSGGYHCHRGQFAGQHFSSKSDMLSQTSAASSPAPHRESVKSPAKAVTGKKEWAIVGQQGSGYFVFVSDEGLRDRTYVAEVLRQVVAKHGKRKMIQVMLFDSKMFTPKGFPMSDVEILHQRAQYNFNPNSGLDEFSWVTVVDKKSSPPKTKETKDAVFSQ